MLFNIVSIGDASFVIATSMDTTSTDSEGLGKSTNLDHLVTRHTKQL